MIRPYPSVYTLGHRAVAEIFSEPVLVQEKVDGSQISFGVYDVPRLALPHEPDTQGYTTDRVLRIRSKGAELVVEAPDKMFAKGVEAIKAVVHLLVPGWTYRGEYLAKPKHNALAYDRVPRNHIVLFDVDRGDQDYLTLPEVNVEANRLGFEAVPSMFVTAVHDPSTLRRLLEHTSFLGGQKVEGVVIKNYTRFDPHTKHVLMAKFVSEAFKEVHAAECKKENPSSGDVIDNLIAQYRTPARWAKAVQHLREDGRLEDAPKDIGELFKEVPEDVKFECGVDIRDALWAWAWPKIRRGITAGLAEWYKDRLLERQFETTE